MNFSTALKLNDVDDYILPSLKCIKPVKIPTSVGKAKSITIEEDGTYVATNESGEKYTLPKVKIDLNDCLACSGCITTAETILVSQHSTGTFLDMLKQPNMREIFVVLSPQSLASLTASLQCGGESVPPRLAAAFAEATNGSKANMEDVQKFCVRLFRSHGAISDFVLDTTWSRDVALVTAAEEFVNVFSGRLEAPVLPVLTGICPGWVCYAEKSHFKIPGRSEKDESFLLQHISRVRSPQQLLAGALKRSLDNADDPLPHRPFLVFVMPCYDKKLEASRAEFTLYGSGDVRTEKEADLVLGTNEFISVLDALLEDSPTTPSKAKTETTPLEQRMSRIVGQDTHRYRHAGSGSGGYAFAVLRYAAERLFNIHLPLTITDDSRVFTRQLANHDLQEILLFSSSEDCENARKSVPAGRTPYRHTGITPTPLLAFLVANGFRNIQTVVQLLKRAHMKAHSKHSNIRSETPFDYVEIMACPNGCLNGGAQLKGDLADVSRVYFSMEQRDLLQSQPAKQLANLDSTIKQGVCYTTYRAVPKIEITNPSALKW